MQPYHWQALGTSLNATKTANADFVVRDGRVIKSRYGPTVSTPLRDGYYYAIWPRQNRYEPPQRKTGENAWGVLLLLVLFGLLGGAVYVFWVMK